METLWRVFAAYAFIFGLGWGSVVLAADGPNPATTSMMEDAVCTKCHDEGDDQPILTMYQTPHGVKADARTPTCQGCHGKSETHLKGDPQQKGRAKPDLVYGTSGGDFPKTSPREQSDVCLGCLKSGLRQHWTGSEHESGDIPCAACHTIRASNDRVLTRAAQPEVCFACHKEQRAQTHLISAHPLAAGKMACSDCHNPHGSAGPKLLKKNTVTETCFTCHADKRGPFLWEPLLRGEQTTV